MVTVILAGIAVTAHNNNEPEPEWLMETNAETGALQKDTTGEDYTLSLTGLNQEMLMFTDRPDREAQTWDTSAFLDYWANEFGDDPPNAVVSANGVRVAVTLGDPQVGTSERAVTFTATPLPGQEPPTSVITQPTLFIDFGDDHGVGFHR